MCFLCVISFLCNRCSITGGPVEGARTSINTDGPWQWSLWSSDLVKQTSFEMAFMKYIVVLVAVLLAAAYAAPAPGGWHGHHEHVVIHVPHHIHTVHHHHVKKVHVPVPVVKKVYIHEEPHYHHDHHPWW
ncbi:hypothetical protein Zmor_008216 [Zophobas morio]|uniref:Histidine-rich glycoprotein n=1 Tax=Zophobas morio TaxID=2755281 RepID=A0AA38IZU0_9CUCU|nr:hypothetical protein Zmor_008216 [Zophobas morio]